MLSRLKKIRFSPAIAISSLALFFSLGGGAMATVNLINGSRIKPKTITIRQLSNQTINELRGKPGQIGPQGPAGPTGSQGAAGDSSSSSKAFGLNFQTQSFDVAPNAADNVFVACPTGQVAIGGGVGSVSSPSQIEAVGPAGTDPHTGLSPDGWRLTISNQSGNADDAGVLEVVCVNP